MRFLLIHKSDKKTESGALPDEKLLAETLKYNTDMATAGVLVQGAGLHPSARGKRVRFSGGTRTVIDGPFSDLNTLIAGYWLIKADSMEEAVEWAKRCPKPLDEEAEIEVRQVFEPEDFGGAPKTQELTEAVDNLRAHWAAKQPQGAGSYPGAQAQDKQ